MSTTTFDELLAAFQNKCNNQLNAIIDTYQNLPEDSLLFKTSPNSWSIAQCFEHLNYYARFYMPAMQKAIKSRNVKEVSGDTLFKSAWLGAYFTKSMHPKTGLKKVRAFEKFSPPENLQAHAVIQEFIHHQETLLEILKIAGNKDLNKIRVPISIAPFIRLKLGDVLGFYTTHIERHLAQAERVYKAQTKV